MDGIIPSNPLGPLWGLPDKSGITQVVLAVSPGESKPETKRLRLFEIALVLVRFNHVARVIETANHEYSGQRLGGSSG
jgi:hypothetical protein